MIVLHQLSDAATPCASRDRGKFQVLKISSGYLVTTSWSMALKLDKEKDGVLNVRSDILFHLISFPFFHRGIYLIYNYCITTTPLHAPPLRQSLPLNGTTLRTRQHRTQVTSSSDAVLPRLASVADSLIIVIIINNQSPLLPPLSRNRTRIIILPNNFPVPLRTRPVR